MRLRHMARYQLRRGRRTAVGVTGQVTDPADMRCSGDFPYVKAASTGQSAAGRS